MQSLTLFGLYCTDQTKKYSQRSDTLLASGPILYNPYIHPHGRGCDAPYLQTYGVYVYVYVSVHAYVCARECVERAEEKQMLFFTSCLFKKSYLLRQGLLLAWSLSSRLSEPQAPELGLQSCAFMFF